MSDAAAWAERMLNQPLTAWQRTLLEAIDSAKPIAVDYAAARRGEKAFYLNHVLPMLNRFMKESTVSNTIMLNGKERIVSVRHLSTSVIIGLAGHTDVDNWTVSVGSRADGLFGGEVTLEKHDNVLIIPGMRFRTVDKLSPLERSRVANLSEIGRAWGKTLGEEPINADTVQKMLNQAHQIIAPRILPGQAIGYAAGGYVAPFGTSPIFGDLAGRQVKINAHTSRLFSNHRNVA